MNTIRTEVKIDDRIFVDVDITDIIDSINTMSMTDRWNYIAQIINDVQLNISDLTDHQKLTVYNYLRSKSSLFEK